MIKNITKKALFIAIFSLLLISPSVNAATIEDSIALQTQYHNVLVQLINLLQAKIADLMAQIQAIQDAQVTQSTQLQQQTQILGAIQQNTTPTPIVPQPVPVEIVSGGGISFDTYGPEIEKNKFVVTGGNCSNLRSQTITAAVKYDNGQIKFIDLITMTIDGKSQTKIAGQEYTYSTTTTEGTAYATFTSGSLSKTVPIYIHPLDISDSYIKIDKNGNTYIGGGADILYDQITHICGGRAQL